MNIFNELNLNGNTINSSKLVNTVLGGYTATAENGAIQYDGGVIKYYYDGSWHTLGTTDGQGIQSFSVGKSGSSNASFTVGDGTRIDFGISNNKLTVKKNGGGTSEKVELTLPTQSAPGPISIYTSNTWPGTPAQNNVVPISIGINDTPTVDNSVKIQGDGKGTVKFTSQYYTNGTSVTTDVVKMTKADISIPAGTTSSNYNIFHLLNTKDVFVQTYFSQNKDSSTSYNFKLVQCDVEIASVDKITVSVNGIPNDGGVLKVIIFTLTSDSLDPQAQDQENGKGVSKTTYSSSTSVDSTQNTGINPIQRN